MAGTAYAKSAFEYTGVVGAEFSTPTLSTKILYPAATDFTLGLGANPMERDDELIGVDEPRSVLPEVYNPTWSTTSRGYPDTLAHLLTGMLGAPTTTAGNNVITDPDGTAIPTGAYRHVFTAPFNPVGYYPQTQEWIVAYKDQSVFYRVKGCATEQMQITVPTTGGVQVQASGPATYINRISDPSLTAAPDGLTTPPFQRAFASVTSWLASSNITVSCSDISFTITNPVTAINNFAVASRFPDSMEKDNSSIMITGTAVARQMAAADWDALLAATGFVAQTRWVSTTNITGSYPFKMYIRLNNAQYVDGAPDSLAAVRRIGGSFNFKGTYAGTAGHAVITIVNDKSSYSTTA